MTDDELAHSDEVRALWAAYWRGENERVPVTFACDEQLWLKASGERFGDFYRVPEVHLRAQLEGQLWFRQHVVGDMQGGIPDAWHVIVRDWMEENDFFGCEVVYQDDDYAWGLPLKMAKTDLLSYMRDLDPEQQIEQSHSYRMYFALRELADGMTFRDRPVHIVPPGGSTTGIFTKGAEVRGVETLCVDLCDDPDFAFEYLTLFTDITVARIRAWYRLTGREVPDLPTDSGFHFCDDSIQLLSPAAYERFVMPCHERLYSTMTTGVRRLHLCGYAEQHFDTLVQKVGVKSLDGPGTFVDHGKYLERFGNDFRFAAQMDHGILEQGNEGQIRSMMRAVLSPSAKKPGRFQIMGFITRLTPMENVRVCYEAAREFGQMK